MKLWADSPSAPSAPTWWCARASEGSSRWWSTSTRSNRKNVRKPAPTSAATVLGSSGSSSIASGSTSKSATATTTPPLSAITVGSEWASRSASAPPANVASTASPVRGIAISCESISGRLRAAGAVAADDDVVRPHRVPQPAREPLQRPLELLVLEGRDLARSDSQTAW